MRDVVTESNLESKQDDALIVLNVVLLSKSSLKLLLRYRSTLGMDDFDSLVCHSRTSNRTIWRRFRRGFLMNFLTRTVTAASDIFTWCSL